MAAYIDVIPVISALAEMTGMTFQASPQPIGKRYTSGVVAEDGIQLGKESLR